MDCPKTRVATVDYNRLYNFETIGIDDIAFEYIFKKMTSSSSDMDELQLYPEEDDMLDVMSDDYQR